MKSPCGKIYCILEDNIIMDLKGNMAVNFKVDSSGSVYGAVAGPYEQCNEPSSSIQGDKFLEQVLNKDSDPQS